jgi:hypothetical protein
LSKQEEESTSDVRNERYLVEDLSDDGMTVSGIVVCNNLEIPKMSQGALSFSNCLYSELGSGLCMVFIQNQDAFGGVLLSI